MHEAYVEICRGLQRMEQRRNLHKIRARRGYQVNLGGCHRAIIPY
jgi:hypothetical protein